MEEELFLISHKSTKAMKGPVLLKDVALLPLVIPSRPNAIRMVVETQMADIGCRPNISLEISGISAILDLVADGAGYAVLPKHALATVMQPELFMARSIIQPKLVSKLSLATAAGRATTLTQKAMLKLIEEIALKILRSPAPSKA
jgi:LysR family nitrogen assimilation transcriptional regulator